MAIPISKYVDIISAVGGAPAVNYKSTMGRFFTTNVLAPMGKVLEFKDAESVMKFFGISSVEYSYAKKYFSFVSKKFVKPKKISFARYTNGTAVPAGITSGLNSFTMSGFSGDKSLTIKYVDPVEGLKQYVLPITISGENLSAVADEIEYAIQHADTSGGTQPFENATVSYTNAGGNGYRFVLSNVGKYGYFLPCEGDLATLLGWDNLNGIFSEGNDGTNSIGEEMSRVFDISDNCYTFAFVEELSDSDHLAVAEWNTNANSQYIYMIWAKTAQKAISLSEDLKNEDCAIVFDNLNELQVYQPMAIGACVDFQKSNASVNFMYQQFPSDTPTVQTKELSDTLDDNKVNYYGATQTAGKLISFFQKGKCLGNFADMTIAFNAIWLKNAVIVDTLNLFLLRDSVPANIEGATLVEQNLNGVFAQGLSNGVILAGKTLTKSEKAFVEAQTGEENAWQQIEKEGYWFKGSIETDDDTGEKFFSYLLIYGAADQIRKVQGTHIALTTTR